MHETGSTTDPVAHPGARGVPAAAPLGGAAPLVDVHAHFDWPGSGRSDWERRNAARLRAGERIGITVHVASILGSWGHTSPTYFPSPEDVTRGNEAMLAVQARYPERVRAYVMVNPNDSAHALAEMDRCAAAGAIGLKLAASRRADDPLLDAVAERAGHYGFPVLHHIWQGRTHEWPGQDASNGVELGRLAARHPGVAFILAHIGGGGDWAHTLAAVADRPNVYLDLSGSGVDRGMLDAAVAAVGAERLLWGCDLTMETGLAKLRALELLGLAPGALAAIRWLSAARLFPPGALPGIAAPRAAASDVQ